MVRISCSPDSTKKAPLESRPQKLRILFDVSKITARSADPWSFQVELQGNYLVVSKIIDGKLATSGRVVTVPDRAWPRYWRWLTKKGVDVFSWAGMYKHAANWAGNSHWCVEIVSPDGQKCINCEGWNSFPTYGKPSQKITRRFRRFYWACTQLIAGITDGRKSVEYPR